MSSVVVVTERCLVCPPQGALFINEGKCRVVQRNMAFKDGVAHGIDCLLTPPSLGGRCDERTSFEVEVGGPDSPGGPLSA